MFNIDSRTREFTRRVYSRHSRERSICANKEVAGRSRKIMAKAHDIARTRIVILEVERLWRGVIRSITRLEHHRPIRSVEPPEPRFLSAQLQITASRTIDCNARSATANIVECQRGSVSACVTVDSDRLAKRLATCPRVSGAFERNSRLDGIDQRAQRHEFGRIIVPTIGPICPIDTVDAIDTVTAIRTVRSRLSALCDDGL